MESTPNSDSSVRDVSEDRKALTLAMSLSFAVGLLMLAIKVSAYFADRFGGDPERRRGIRRPRRRGIVCLLQPEAQLQTSRRRSSVWPRQSQLFLGGV